MLLLPIDGSVREIGLLTKQRADRIYNRTDVRLRTSTPDTYLSGLLAQLFREVNRHHQDRCLGRELDDTASGIQAIHLGHLKINDNQVGAGPLEALHCLFAVASLITDDPIGLLIQQPTKAPPHRRAVVRYQDPNQRNLPLDADHGLPSATPAWSLTVPPPAGQYTGHLTGQESC